MVISNKPVQECDPLARSGRECISRTKEMTVVMVPYDKFSPFPKAVDELYRTIRMPFNLIVVEGNAPDIVRVALEKRQRQHGNITIIYSRHRPTISGAINLAAPHVKTPYAFIMDNGVKLSGRQFMRLVHSARESGAGIVCPRNFITLEDLQNKIAMEDNLEIPLSQIGPRSCFLIRGEALQKMGRFDEELDPFTVGIDITMHAKARGICVVSEDQVRIEGGEKVPFQSIDMPLYEFQWSLDRARYSLRRLSERWGINLRSDSYLRWVATKRKAAEYNHGTGLGVIVNQIGAKIQEARKSAANLLGSMSGGGYTS